MSLFDVIKYPISDEPTNEQIKALPNDIFAKWYDWWLYNPTTTPVWSPNSVKYLRNLILEYQEFT